MGVSFHTAGISQQGNRLHLHSCRANPGSMVVIAFLSTVISACIEKGSSKTIMFSIALSAADLFTDVSFVYTLTGVASILGWTFLILPVTLKSVAPLGSIHQS